jgi:hypothetical protein
MLYLDNVWTLWSLRCRFISLFWKIDTTSILFHKWAVFCIDRRLDEGSDNGSLVLFLDEVDCVFGVSFMNTSHKIKNQKKGAL